MSWKEKFTPSRIAAGLVALCGLGAAIAVPLADMEWEDTTSILGGLAAITGITYKWLDGRSKWEVAEVGAETPTNPGPINGSPAGDGEDTATPEYDEGDAMSNIGPDGRPLPVAETIDIEEG